MSIGTPTRHLVPALLSRKPLTETIQLFRDEAAQQVLGFPGAIYQWFAELADAQAFVAAYRNDRADHYWGPDRSEDKPRFN